jgi:hypothetical protein
MRRVRARTEDDQRRVAADAVDVDPERQSERRAARDVEDVGVKRVGPEGFVEAHRDLLDPAEADSLDGCDRVAGQRRLKRMPRRDLSTPSGTATITCEPRKLTRRLIQTLVAADRPHAEAARVQKIAAHGLVE